LYGYFRRYDLLLAGTLATGHNFVLVHSAFLLDWRFTMLIAIAPPNARSLNEAVFYAIRAKMDPLILANKA
jgi:hypothetical protein